MPTIQAITFDVGGTMIQPWPSVGHIYAAAAARSGHNGLDATLLNHRFIKAWRNLHDFSHRKEEWSALVDDTFAGLLPQAPSATFFPELYAEFARASAWKIYDDVIPTLEELASRDIPMAIVSNWDERLRPLLEELRLDGYFEAIMISSELYFTKPSNVIFDHAIRKLGVPAGSVLHVGDSVREDVGGAKAAGLQSLLLDRFGPEEAGRTNTLSGVLKLLDPPHDRARRELA